MKGRQRGRNGGKPRMHHQGSGGGRNPNFDPNAGRMRGNAQQLMDKFLALARDATSQGDRVLAENYFQHADHYYRVINARFEGQQNQQPRRFNGPNQQDRGYDGQDGQDNQGNYQDYNNGNSVAPGPSQNLIPQNIPDQIQPVMQPSLPIYDPGYQSAPQPAPPEPEADIGLPPQLFGNPPQQAEPAGNGESQGNGGSERPPARPRQSSRRRFAGRQGTPRATESPSDAT